MTRGEPPAVALTYCPWLLGVRAVAEQGLDVHDLLTRLDVRQGDGPKPLPAELADFV
jgi:hypothetical protein